MLPPGVQILAAAGRTRTTEEMTRAFRLNLTALSLLALVCGAFLIYNTMTFSVVQRRQWIGTLRALGVSRREIFTLVLGEAAAVALLGTAAGPRRRRAPRARAGAAGDADDQRPLLRGLRARAGRPALDARRSAPCSASGRRSLAALVPAIEATQAPPRAALLRSTLEARLRRSLPRDRGLGVGLLAAGGALLRCRATWR